MKPERPTASSAKKGAYFECRAPLWEVAGVALALFDGRVIGEQVEFSVRVSVPQHRWEQSVMRKLENDARKQGGQTDA